jgi:predicted nucleotidyltransferase
MREIDGATEAAVQLFLSLIAGSYQVNSAILFGSRARGTHREDSDADLAILLPGDRNNNLFWETIRVMSDFAFDVMLETGIDINPLPIWEEEWTHPERYPNPALLEKIATEGVLLRAARPDGSVT